jgi:hypothetical protein
MIQSIKVVKLAKVKGLGTDREERQPCSPKGNNIIWDVPLEPRALAPSRDVFTQALRPRPLLSRRDIRAQFALSNRSVLVLAGAVCYGLTGEKCWTSSAGLRFP